MQKTSSAKPEVSVRVELNKERVIEIWEERLRREIPSARSLSEPLLKNSLPGWLDRLVKTLAVPESTVKLEKLSTKSREHGSQRAEMQFDLNELLYEYTILRQVLVEQAETFGPLAVRERDIILNAVDLSVRSAVSEYMSKQRTNFQREALKNVEVSPVMRVLRTFVIVGIFAGLQLAAWPVLQPLTYIFFYPAVTVAALFGNAPLAIFLSLFTVEWVFDGNSIFTHPTWANLIRILAFSSSALLISHITRKLRVSRKLALAAVNNQEEARMEAERTVASLDALLGSSPFGVGFLDKDLKFVRVNEPLARWSGYSADFHVGKTLKQLMGSTAAKAEELLRPVLETGVPLTAFEYETSLPNSRDQLRTFLISIYPVKTASGETLGVGFVILDITSQKKSETALREQKERLDLAIHAGDIGVWEYNPQNGKLIWTDRQFQIFGMKPSDAIDWPRFTERIHPEDRQSTLKKIDDAFAQDSDSYLQFEYRILRPDGQLRWVQSNSQLLKGGNGKTLMAGTNIDITERKKAEILREQFVSTLSHDLRTPLTAARMAAQLAIRNVSNRERVIMNAAKVMESLDRADRMIRDLLDANQIRGGQRLPIHPVDAELCSVVKSTVDELSTIHGDRFRIVEKNEVHGNWDVTGLRRMIENLCSNAVKYGEPGSKVSLYIEEVGGNAEIRVHNYGEPIAHQDRDKLFDYLHRASGAQTSGKVGWGIGLTLVRGVTEAHGGQVTVNSEPGAGTTFIVTLPLVVDIHQMPEIT